MSTTPDALIKLGYEARREKKLKEAKQSFANAVELCRSAGDQPGLARSLSGLGQIERDLKNYGQAFQHYEEAANIYRDLPDPLLFAHTLRHAADILRHQDSYDSARSRYEEALAIYRAHRETSNLDLANAIRGFALLLSDGGETEQATSLWREARSLYDAANVQAGVQESDAQIKKLAGK